MPFFDDGDWTHATAYPTSRILSASMIEPDRRVETLTPVEIGTERALNQLTAWLKTARGDKIK